MPDRPAFQLKLANSTIFSKTALLTVSKIVYTHHASLTASSCLASASEAYIVSTSVVISNDSFSISVHSDSVVDANHSDNADKQQIFLLLCGPQAKCRRISKQLSPLNTNRLTITQHELKHTSNVNNNNNKNTDHTGCKLIFSELIASQKIVSKCQKVYRPTIIFILACI